MLLASLLLLTFILCNSSGLAGVDTHDVPIFPAADVISDVNGVPAVVCLLTCCNCLITFITSVIIFLAFLLCWRLGGSVVAFNPVAFVPTAAGGHAKLKLSSLLLIVAGAITVAFVIAIASVRDVAGIPDVASVSLVSAVLTVAGVPAVDGGAVARFPAVTGIPYFSWCLYILYCTIIYIRQSDYRSRLPDCYFFSAIGLSEYRISDWQIRSAFFGSRHSSDY
jgi:hypothetical protein